MSYRDRMSGSNMSQAEVDVWMALNKRGIHGFDANRRIPLKWTVPDFFFKLDGSKGCDGLALYLDGEQVHMDVDRDESITKQLEAMHFKVLRYRYNPPLSQERKLEIVDAVEEELKK